MVNVTIKAAMRHGDLHLAAKKVGGITALAKLLDVSPAVLGSWYRYSSCPPCSEVLPHWPNSKIDDLEKRLYALTGKLLEDLFPPAVRDKAFLELDKTAETTKEVDSTLLIDMAERVRRLEYKEPDAIEQKELEQAVNASLGALNDRERAIIKMRYGIGCEPMTQIETGAKLKITGARVSILEAKAIRKLQAPSVAQKLSSHVGN